MPGDGYKEISVRLQDKFPAGTVIEGNPISTSYIPVQAYISRLESEAAGLWEWRLVKEPTPYPDDKAIYVQGELSIAGTVRSGIGFSYYSVPENKKSVAAFKNAVNSAESDAIRNACDKFLMGWKDLAPYREWASNPGVGLAGASVKTAEETTGEICTRCKKSLSPEDLLFLKVNSIRIKYCIDHVPAHLKKN